jgi:redox-sensitive bicupin YhaK (pirin superfamily)
MQKVYHEAASRGYAKHGWLTTHHSFSFASYYDPMRMGFGALRVLNDDAIAPGSGFGRHPHDNMEIITIPLSGSLKHEDSMGNSAVVTAGEVQVMSAGTGVEHAEWNASETEELTLLQIWILTKTRNVSPRYDQQRFEQVDYTNQLLQVVGAMGKTPGLGIHQEARIFLGRLEAGQKLTYDLADQQHGVYFFVMEGAATIAEQPLKRRDALGIWETDQVVLEATEELFVVAIEVPMD